MSANFPSLLAQVMCVSPGSYTLRSATEGQVHRQAVEALAPGVSPPGCLGFATRVPAPGNNLPGYCKPVTESIIPDGD